MNSDITSLVVQGGLIGLALLLLLRGLAPAQGSADGKSSSEPTESRLGGAGTALAIAACFALITALLQLSLAGINHYLRERFIFASPDYVWMAPAAYLIIYLVLAAGWALLALLFPRFRVNVATSGFFAGLSVFSLLLPFAELTRVSIILLSIGVAVQVGRSARGGGARWLRRVRLGLGALTAVTVAMVATQFALRSGSGSVVVTAADHAPAGAPNVLLLVWDTVRAANLNLYGYAPQTSPRLSALAGEGVTFDRAFSTAPWTLKSHASMFAGLDADAIQGDFVSLVRGDSPMLAERLQAGGYATGGFVANLLYTSRESGLARGFEHYDDYHPTMHQLLGHAWLAHTPVFKQIMGAHSLIDVLWSIRHIDTQFDERNFNSDTYARRSSSEITSAFLEWQKTVKGRPFFAFLNFFDAHMDYKAPDSLLKKFAQPAHRSLGKYDASIATIDDNVGRMLDELQRTGALDNTIVIITSDHGELFGEHGLTEHANALYLPLLHVPLVIRYPARVPRGVRVSAPVTLRDLTATVLDLTGLGKDAKLPGTSFSALWSTEVSTDTAAPIVAHLGAKPRPEENEPVRFGAMRSALDAQYHFIRRGDGEEELFDYLADPAEAHNLMGTAAGDRVLPRLRAAIDKPHQE